MTLDEIQKTWETDSKIDISEISQESIKTPMLHHKYYKMFSTERLRLKKMEADFKALRLAKYEFYTIGTMDDTPDDWDLPPQGRILKNESQQYIDADKHIIAALLAVDYQKEKVMFLESILDNISRRGFFLKTAVDWERFKVGG